MTNEQLAVFEIKHAIDSQNIIDKNETMRLHEIIKSLVNQNGMRGVLALALVGAEMAAE